MDTFTIIIILLVGATLSYFSTEGVKSQFIRLIDILFFGPFLIWVALKEKNKLIQIILLLMGISTIIYNLRNYIFQKDSI